MSLFILAMGFQLPLTALHSTDTATTAGKPNIVYVRADVLG